MPSLTLHEITSENWRMTLRLGVHPEQQRFVAEYAPVAAIMLAKAFVKPGGLLCTPYVIAMDMEFVGMVELAHERINPSECGIYHFFIDRKWQGRGYGALPLTALLELIAQRLPGCAEIHLTVHPENTVAQSLYVRAGFRPTGEERDGESVYVLKMKDLAVRADERAPNLPASSVEEP